MSISVDDDKRRGKEPPSDDDNDGSRQFGTTEQQKVEIYADGLRVLHRDLDQLAESLESTLPPTQAQRIREQRNSANESIDLRLVKVVYDPSGTLSRQAVESIPQVLDDTENLIEEIQHLSEVILEVAPDARSLWTNLPQIIPGRVREISVRANAIIAELEDFVIETIGDSYYVSGLMLSPIGMLSGVNYR